MIVCLAASVFCGLGDSFFLWAGYLHVIRPRRRRADAQNASRDGIRSPQPNSGVS
jgi:hypothetical protein